MACRRFYLLTPLLVLLLTTAAAAQTPLVVGEAAAGTLATGDVDRYALALDGDRFVVGAADQLSVDVVVTVIGPDGAVLESGEATAEAMTRGGPEGRGPRAPLVTVDGVGHAPTLIAEDQARAVERFLGP